MKSKVIYNGKEIEVPAFHARRLIEAGKATWPAQPSSNQSEQRAETSGTTNVVGEDTASAPKQKRTYKRRDMQAED